MSMPIVERAAQWALKAEDHADKGAFAPAIAAYSKAIFLEPDAYQHFMGRGRMFVRLCDFQSALINLRKALRLSNNSPTVAKQVAVVYFIIARVNLDDNEVDEGLRKLDMAISLDPSASQYTIFRIHAYIAQHKYDVALMELNKLLEPFDPFKDDEPNESDNSDKNKKKKKKKKKKNKNNTKPDFSDIDLVLLRCRLLLIINRPEDAQTSVAWAHLLDPSHPELKTLVITLQQKGDSIAATAMGHLLGGQLDMALSSASKAVSLNPNTIDYYKLRATVHRKMRNFDGALTDLKDALSLFMRRKDSYTAAATQAVARQKLKQQQHALPAPNAMAAALMSPAPLTTAIDKAIERDLALTFSELAMEYNEAKKPHAALVCLTKAIELHPTCSTYYVQRGDIHRIMSDLTNALSDYNKAQHLRNSAGPVQIKGAQALSSRTSIVHNDLGQTLYNDAQFVPALLEFSKAIELEPRLAKYYKNRGLCQYRLQSFADAFKDYKRAVELDPHDDEARSLMLALQRSIFNTCDRQLLDAAQTTKELEFARAAGAHPIAHGRRATSRGNYRISSRSQIRRANNLSR